MCDFGVSKFKDKTYLSTKNAVGGTPSYMVRVGCGAGRLCVGHRRELAWLLVISPPLPHVRVTSLYAPLPQAPEMFAGGRVDEKCDVFSFGVLLWECLTSQVVESNAASWWARGYAASVSFSLLQQLSPCARARFEVLSP